MPTWTAELSFDGFTFTADPFAAGGRRSNWQVGLEAISMPLANPMPQFNLNPDGGDYYFSVAISDSGGAFQGVQFRFSDAEVRPTGWSSYFGVPSLSGSAALLTAGGTLSITKDFAGNLITFAGPLGTQSVALSTLAGLTGGGLYNNNDPLRPRGFAHEFALPDPTVLEPAYDVTDTVQWFNLIGRQNGAIYETVALSSADPGNWWPIFALAFDPASGGTTSSLTPWWAFVQLASREAVDVAVAAASFPTYRIFDTFKRRRPVMPANPLDLTTMPEHDLVFGAWEAMPGVPVVRRSHEHGHTWADYEVLGATGGDSITIQTFAGQVWICYYDGARIVTQESLDLGLSWSTALPVSITGTNPRLVIAPEGTFFYFYFSGTNLVLSRSNDFGVTLFDITPIPITASLTAQDFGAVLAADRSLVVSYIKAGNWESKRSLDWGNTWALA